MYITVSEASDPRFMNPFFWGLLRIAALLRLDTRTTHHWNMFPGDSTRNFYTEQIRTIGYIK